MRHYEQRAYFDKVLKKLDIIDAKVSAMPHVQVQVSERFLPTIIALSKLGRPALAGEVAAVTGASVRMRACFSTSWWEGELLLRNSGAESTISV